MLLQGTIKDKNRFGNAYTDFTHVLQYETLNASLLTLSVAYVNLKKHSFHEPNHLKSAPNVLQTLLDLSQQG